MPFFLSKNYSNKIEKRKDYSRFQILNKINPLTKLKRKKNVPVGYTFF